MEEIQEIDVDKTVGDAIQSALDGVRHDIKRVMYRSRYESDVVQFYRDEITKHTDFNDTVAGCAYINSGFPECGIDEWKSILVEYYSTHKRIRRDCIYVDAMQFMSKVLSIHYLEMCIDRYKAKTPPEKIINEEALKKYFTATFKGAGNNGFNYFDYLIEDIKNVRNPKEAARMALIIYKCDKMIKTQRPNTFKEWHKLFCEMAGCTYNPDYKPSNLDTNKMKIKLSYL